VPTVPVPDGHSRLSPLNLPELAEPEISRHYSALSKRAFGVNCGFYPLGSCTMKYNPKINEEIAALPGFTDIHPLAPKKDIEGCIEALSLAGRYLCEITGMDDITFQPAAGAHGEFTGLLLIKAYHEARGDKKRTKIIVPDSAHGTNPASASMAGFEIINVPSGADGRVDPEILKSYVGADTAGIMMTNPNTLGLFENKVKEITDIVHAAGGMCYYDGANLNAIMGIARPGDMGFDAVHLNLHKTFSTPHGGGGPGSGPVGTKKHLSPYLPVPLTVSSDGSCKFDYENSSSIGSVGAFYGNFLVVLKALSYILSLGAEGLLLASQTAVLNANYMMSALSDIYDVAVPGRCMHEFVLSLERLKKESGVSALDIAKSLLDNGMHPPTMYFPLIVHEALMIEPTETETKQTLDYAVEVLRSLYQKAKECPDELHSAPRTTPVGRPDEVKAARSPKVRYSF
jgi:glycine dehydrogenase subunit 2